MTRTVFDNAMVAHVWAQRTQTEGRSSNGNFYFQGPFLYSYGTHFLVGYVLPDGRALLNSDGYSMSTAKQKNYAARAVRYQGLSVPNLTEFESVLRGADQAADIARTDPTPDKYFQTRIDRALALITREAPKLAKGQQLNPNTRWPGFGHFPEPSAALLLEALGLSPAKAARAAAKAIKTRESNRAKWIAAEKAAKFHATLSLARETAARPLSDLLDELQTHERSGRLNARLDGPRWETKAKELFRAAKLAKAEGKTAIAARVMAHYRLIRERVAMWPELEGPAEVRAAIRSLFVLARAGRRVLDMSPRELGDAESTANWNEKPSRVASDTLAAARKFGLIPGEAPASGRAVAGLGKYLSVMGDSPRAVISWAEFSNSLRAVAERAELGAWRATTRRRVAAFRAFREALARDPETVDSAVARAAKDAAQTLLGSWQVDSDPGRNAWKVAGWTREAMATLFNGSALAENNAKAREREKVAEAKAKWDSDCRAAWLAGLPQPTWDSSLPFVPYRGRMDDGQEGALIRARGVIRDESGMITGGTLETSQGAEVPLTHAIRAFRFLKLCRDKGQAWHANGKTLPVGHFKVDHVDSEGNFRAGCHRINWGEVARLAAELGLDHLAPANTTEPTPGR